MSGTYPVVMGDRGRLVVPAELRERFDLHPGASLVDNLLADRRRSAADEDMNLFDSSALLCFLQDEDGSDIVERELLGGGACSAVNWLETAQKVRGRGSATGGSRGASS